MNFTNLEGLGNPYVREVVEIHHTEFEGILSEDRPFGQIIEEVKAKIFTDLFDDGQLLSFVEEVSEKNNALLKKKMERIILDEMNVLIFNDIAISIYNLKVGLGVNESFKITRSIILDPINCGNPMIISIALKMEEKGCLK